jgi:hypothetical protein
MKNLEKYSKKELREIASWYDVDIPYSTLKNDMVKLVEGLLEPPAEVQTEEVQMSVRVKRIKEQNQGV